MISTRIKQRPVLFTIWLISSSLLLASIATFVKGIGYFGDTKQIMFMCGGLLIQDAPVKGAAMGLKSFDVEMPDRGIWIRIQGFFMYPKRIGSALWVPFGSTLMILVTFISWRYWRMLEPPLRCCEQCGGDLTGNTNGICPECRTTASIESGET